MQDFPQVLKIGGSSSKFDGGLESVHGGAWGKLKTVFLKPR